MAHEGDKVPQAGTPELILPGLGVSRIWLTGHAAECNGVWLVLAKKGRTRPTTLTYDDALCHGRIDGQLAGGREGTTADGLALAAPAAPGRNETFRSSSGWSPKTGCFRADWRQC